jgi:two-component system heavy metal sensor histidine kinase CusS
LAHELRSPIQNLLGEIEVTLRQDRDADRFRSVLESNLEEVRDLGEAVHDLMLLCTNPEDSNALCREDFDLDFEARVRLAGEIA